MRKKVFVILLKVKDWKYQFRWVSPNTPPHFLDYQTYPDWKFVDQHKKSFTIQSDIEEIVHDEGINIATELTFGTPLFNSKILDVIEVIGILESPTMMYTSIPNGIKENVISSLMKRRIKREILKENNLSIVMIVVLGIKKEKAVQPLTIISKEA